ncbi:MAG: YhgE/Pip protein [Microbacteriaceae bacterium]|nr:YhgE/Pip protein [Microbacteriaceae bacterium]
MSPSISPARRSLAHRAAIIAVVLVPLAFAGLFVGALAQATTAVDRIPAAIVNSDKLVYSTAADGTKSPIFAGRQLVTELTGGSKGFDWTITNSADAEQQLKDGTVDAILTVPKNFSSSIMSLSSSSPERANLAIRTDDSHSYLTGAVAQSVGDGLVSAFGVAITEQYISGISAGIGTLGSSLHSAANGASSLASGATGLSGGLGTLSGGVSSAASGASSLAGGVTQYTGGVDSLSSGLRKLNAGAANLTPLSNGISGVAGGVAALSAQLAAATAAPVPDQAAIATISQQLAAASAELSALSGQNASLATGIQSGVKQSASGSTQLSAGSESLRSGASSLSAGLGELSAGATSASTGAAQLATGVSQLAGGLQSGADQVPATSPSAAAQTAKIAADPVGLTVTRDNKISSLGQVIATFFVPLGLWVGALAVFLVLRPLSRRALSSSAGNGRLVLSALGRASAVTVAQAVLLVALLHVALHVSWALLPATLGFSLVLALAFTAFHYLLTIAFGRAGLVISLLLLAIQVTSTGGLYPVQMLAAPFQLISPFLPLTYGVAGMQGIIAGGNAGSVVAAAFTLLAFGLASVLVSLLVVRRTRRAQALGLTSALPLGSHGGQAPQVA